MVRIGSMEYEPLEAVKRVTLDFLVEKRVKQEQQRMASKQGDGTAELNRV